MTDTLITITTDEGDVVFEQSYSYLTENQRIAIAAMASEPEKDDPEWEAWADAEQKARDVAEHNSVPTTTRVVLDITHDEDETEGIDATVAEWLDAILQGAPFTDYEIVAVADPKELTAIDPEGNLLS